MIEFKAKLWRGVGVAALVAGGLGLVACSPGGEGGEAAQHGEAGEAAKGAGGGEAGESAAGEAGGEGGEAGAASAYAGLDAATATQVRLAHLKGFLLIAKRELDAGRAPEAGALVGQGVLEVYTPAPAAFAGFEAGPLNAAAADLMDAKPAGAAALDAGLAAIGAKQAGDLETVRRMLSIAGGLYRIVVVDGAVDPIEYQHSLGAALAAQDAFARAEPALKAKNAARAAEAKAELERLLALWPTVQAPEAPTPNAQVAAQISRVELALSGL